MKDTFKEELQEFAQQLYNELLDPTMPVRTTSLPSPIHETFNS